MSQAVAGLHAMLKMASAQCVQLLGRREQLQIWTPCPYPRRFGSIWRPPLVSRAYQTLRQCLRSQKMLLVESSGHPERISKEVSFRILLILLVKSLGSRTANHVLHLATTALGVDPKVAFADSDPLS